MSKRRQDIVAQSVSLAKRTSSATRRARGQAATQARPAGKGGGSAVRGEGKSTGTKKSTAKSTGGTKKSTAKSTGGTKKSTAKKSAGPRKPNDQGASVIGSYLGKDDLASGVVAWPVILFRDGIVITHASNLRRALGTVKILKQGLSGIPTIGGANPALQQNLADRAGGLEASPGDDRQARRQCDSQ